MMVDALSQRYTLILVLGAKLLRLQSMQSYYSEDAAFKELVKDTPSQAPYTLQEGFLFKGNKPCVLACPLRELLVRETHRGSLTSHFGLTRPWISSGSISFGLEWEKMFIGLCRDVPSATRPKANSIRAFTPHF